MIKVYAVLLVLGVLGLIGWIMATVFAGNIDRPGMDAETRFGVAGRRAVAGAVGFGMAGMSAEYSPLDLSWPVGLVLALVGAVAAAWYAGKVGLEPQEPS
ncbi:MAG TPA: hypothetical protein VLB67_12450 [Acidimicrobiia bacterium]|nr:hypothetical protein [Acidimicrobiia bacterium]